MTQMRETCTTITRQVRRIVYQAGRKHSCHRLADESPERNAANRLLLHLASNEVSAYDDEDYVDFLTAVLMFKLR